MRNPDEFGRGRWPSWRSASAAAAAVWVSLSVFVAAGCSDVDQRTSEAEGLSKSANAEIVDRLRENLDTVVAAEARRRAESASVGELLDRASAARSESGESEGEDPSSSGDGAGSGERGGLVLQHRAVLEHLYAGRDHEMVWYTDRGGELEPSEAALALHEMLVEGVESHGLWPDQLHLATVRQVGERSAGWESAEEEISIGDSQREKLLEYLASEGMDLDPAEEMGRLAEVVADPEGPLPTFAERIGARAERIENQIRDLAERELILSDALAEYLVEMRYGNPAWHQPRSWRATFRVGNYGRVRAVDISGEPHEVTAADVVKEAVHGARERAMMAEKVLAIFENPGSVEKSLRGVQPPYRQYERLTRAFETYRDYVENGGWPEVAEAAEGLKIGYRSPHVPVLKERLLVEGYWEPPEDAVGGEDGAGRGGSSSGADERFSKRFGEPLREALSTYQQTHQFYAKGVLRGPTLSSLNVSARERWNQIRVTLERWRNSRIGADTHYVHVNIPDFHAEVWRDGERQMRFRIITGSSKRKENEETQEFVYPRETPRFSDEIQYMVFNPYWNVPESIRENELKPKLRKDPSFLERNNYEVVRDEHGNQFIRQKPGPENSLGEVKFLFPNEHSVYMHDTPDRFLFDKPTRGYSHGCVRIENPMEFAGYLMDLDGRWTGRAQDEQIEEWKNQEEEHWVTLRETLPVHLEYYVVRVGDRGRVNFLADLYDLDEPRLERVEKRLQRYSGRYDLPERGVDELMSAALAGEWEDG